MTLYLDTSVLVAALTNERSTESVLYWMEVQDLGLLHISHWVETEFSSALALKVRTGQMTLEMRTVSQSDFVDLASNSLTILDIRPRHFRAAANLSDNIALGIRAPDALHLAVAVDNGATLCTLDKKLAAGAAALGAKVNLLSPAP